MPQARHERSWYPRLVLCRVDVLKINDILYEIVLALNHTEPYI